MSKIKRDLFGGVENFTFILAKQNGEKLGVINTIDLDAVQIDIKLVEASEFSFTVNKELNGKTCTLWQEIKPLRLVWLKELNLWFQINVDLQESSSTTKTVQGVSLGHSELSQIILRNIELNTEDDISREDYLIPSVLYDDNNKKSSILHRLFEKAPHYKISHVDTSIKGLIRQFSFNEKSLYDSLQEIAEEVECLFLFPVTSYGSKIIREVKVYDLKRSCNECGYRFDSDGSCPKCGSENVKEGYGEDTNIFVSSENLAENLTKTPDSDSVKNCFKLVAGDDLMTATIQNCLPSGDGYLWYFSEDLLEDVSNELREKIILYNKLYNSYNEKSDFSVSSSDYNSLVEKYSTEKSGFPKIAPEAGAKDGDILLRGFSSVVAAYYSTIEFENYLKSSMMPTYTIPEATAESEIASLQTKLTSIALQKLTSSTSSTTVETAIKSISQLYVNTGIYNITVQTSSWENPVWKGYVSLTNWGDEEDTAKSNLFTLTVIDDYKTYIELSINKKLSSSTAETYDVEGLFAMSEDSFSEALHLYSLDCLKSFYSACQTCLDVLIEQGCGETSSYLYDSMYAPWKRKLNLIQEEMDLRESEVSTITEGLQKELLNIISEIHEDLDFQNFVGEDLWLEFCAYRREDTYKNENYISDGLTDAELVSNANAFINTAKDEIFKAAHIKYSISASLSNLLIIPAFSCLVDSFEVGNWLRVMVDSIVHRLRLVSYSISGGSLENLTVEFSEVEEIHNGSSDLRSLIGKMSSISSSYDYVARQASNGAEADKQISDWLEEGLNSALVQIKSNKNEEITYDSHGLLARSYDDITETYAPEQFKLTHNILAYTSDNWETVSAALGKHDYVKWEDSQWRTAVDYGLSAKFVAAGYVTGSQVIGGEIVSSNYSPGEKGAYLDLVNGDFELAGGNFSYNFSNNKLSLKDVFIEWETANAPDIGDISNLSSSLEELRKGVTAAQGSADEAQKSAVSAETNSKKYADLQDGSLSETLTSAYKTYSDSAVSKLDSAVASHLGLGGSTVIGANQVISPYIGGGYLNITGTDNKARVLIDPNNLTGNDYLFQVHNGNQVSVGIDKSGNALFRGSIYATSLTLGSGVSVSTKNIAGLSTVATSGSYSDLLNKPTIPSSVSDLGLDASKIIFKGDIKQAVKTDSNGLSYVETTVPASDGKTISYSTYNADNYIVFGRSKGTNSSGKDYVCISKDGLLTARNAVIYGTIYATDGEFSGKISTATLDANSIRLNGALNVYSSSSKTEKSGFIGYKTGLLKNDGDTYVTDGICVSNNKTDSYFIVTDSGARMQSNAASIYVSDGNLAAIKTTGTVSINGSIVKINEYEAIHAGNYKNYPAVFA